MTGISGLDDPGDSRGFALLDYDRDGWLDVAQVNLSAPRVRLLRNRIADRGTARKNGFVAFRLVGGNRTAKASRDWSARDGFGATVELTLADGSKVYREHRTEDGYMTQHTTTMVIGIGPRQGVADVTVRWPSGRTQTTKAVASGSLVIVHEGKACEVGSYGRSGSE
ncbi:MAG: ASPIC/UnbV domain-containing protein [Planctomycetota bacterium]